ncbi:MAG: capsular biosynthesis protein [Verrucomicrobia bacterium]|nr:capsular biosynthesis protein [Cytophagales bacterium]
MHSHLLPGIDDGAETLEQSLALIKELMTFGFRRFVTTPHVMGDFYKNTPEIIAEKLALVRNALTENNLEVSIEAAAEYYLDEWFVEKLEKEEKLLTFGKNYLLFETSYLNAPPQLNQTIFKLKTQGYQPVLAHPERYAFFYDNFQGIETLFQNGVLLQLNLNSISGYYGKAAQVLAEKMIDKKMVHFAGSDCHAHKHIQALEQTIHKKYYQRLTELPLLNFSL